MTPRTRKGRGFRGVTVSTSTHPALITEHPTTIAGWETAIDGLLAANDLDPLVRSAALELAAEKVEDTAWVTPCREAATTLVQRARAGVDPDLDPLEICFTALFSTSTVVVNLR